MTTPRIVVVVPTIRPDSHAAFIEAWTPLFEKHRVTLVTVWDGERPVLDQRVFPHDRIPTTIPADWVYAPENRDLFCRHTDACRNLGFVAAAAMDPTHVLTLDDDCYPIKFYDTKGEYHGDGTDPIQAHLDALARRVPLSWMNTAHDTDLYLRGVPYGVRDEAPVMLSHGVWVGTPDFDGETQLRLEAGKRLECAKCGVLPSSDWSKETVDYQCRKCRGMVRESAATGVPHSLPYYVGPIPRGVNFPLCGMNVMVTRDALPYLYYAPMGADSGVPDLHRFADIFMGVFLKHEFDRLGWGVVTGYSTIHHTRASDARKNFEQEELGREWIEQISSWFQPQDALWVLPREYTPEAYSYFRSYASKRSRYADLVAGLLRKDG